MRALRRARCKNRMDDYWCKSKNNILTLWDERACAQFKSIVCISKPPEFADVLEQHQYAGARQADHSSAGLTDVRMRRPDRQQCGPRYGSILLLLVNHHTAL